MEHYQYKKELGQGINLGLQAINPPPKVTAVGSYTGNGGGSQQITGIGLKPVGVFVFDTMVNYAWFFSSSNYPSNYGNMQDADGPAAGFVNTYILSFGTNDFTVGSTCNAAGATYQYIAWR